MQTQTLNIALPKELVKKVDEVAKREYRNLSELIREALRSYLEKTEVPRNNLTIEQSSNPLHSEIY